MYYPVVNEPECIAGSLAGHEGESPGQYRGRAFTVHFEYSSDRVLSCALDIRGQLLGPGLAEVSTGPIAALLSPRRAPRAKPALRWDTAARALAERHLPRCCGPRVGAESDWKFLCPIDNSFL